MYWKAGTLLFLACLVITECFNKRLAVSTYLEESSATYQDEFPAMAGDQMYILKRPIKAYGQIIDQIKIYSNGFIALKNHSLKVPNRYPHDAQSTGHRLHNLGGDFIGVFTTVNQCSKSGRVLIRETEIAKLDNQSCAWQQLNRLTTAIRLAYANSSSHFTPDYVLSITWTDMGCITHAQPPRNTFSLVLIANSNRTFAVFQYIDIEWTTGDGLSPPPEAGIFMNSFESHQLPRNNKNVEPSFWNTETNIAVDGEWILAMDPIIPSSNTSFLVTIREFTESFLDKTYYECLSNGKTPTNSRKIKEMSNTQKDIKLDIVDDTDLDVSANNSNFQTETKIAWNSKEQNEQGIPHNMVAGSNFARCSESECNDQFADCFVFDSSKCCVCKPGYYGGGEEKCTNFQLASSRRMYFNGTIKIQLKEENLNLEIPMFIDTTLKTAENIVIRSGIRNLPAENNSNRHKFVGVITPLLHFLNSLFSFPLTNDKSSESQSRIYNIFSLSGGFSNEFKFNQHIDVENHGKLEVSGTIKKEQSTKENYLGSILLEIKNINRFLPINKHFTESDEVVASKPPEIEFFKSAADQLTFSEKQIFLKSPDGSTLKIKWSAEATTNKSCLLSQNSIFPMNQKMEIKLSDQGYCHEDCRGDDGCAFYCLDMPHLISNTKTTGNEMSQDVCSLPLETGPCRAHMPRFGFDSHTGTCKRFVYGGCRGNDNNFKSEQECLLKCKNSKPVVNVPLKQVCNLPLETGPCRARMQRFGFDPQTGTCRRFVYGGCKGNSNNFESEQECLLKCKNSKLKTCVNVRCGQNAVCENGVCVCLPECIGNPRRGCQCKSVEEDECSGKRCGQNSYCREGVCICNAGYIGDPYRRCSEISDKCDGVECAENAECQNGKCICKKGFSGDGAVKCVYYAKSRCENVRCQQNAVCADGRCVCEPGYSGDPRRGCQKSDEREDRCARIRCRQNAICAEGKCICSPGFSGDPERGCQQSEGGCANIRCMENAVCENGRCVCMPGYSGDPRRGCTKSEESYICGRRRCGKDARCVNEVCVCPRGYEGDPLRQCVRQSAHDELCGRTKCHVKAQCHNEECFCEYGYIGDGVNYCEKLQDDLCKRVSCAENAVCDAGLCQCKAGFSGDGFNKCTRQATDPALCDGKYCGSNAECRQRRCYCQSGFKGDPYDVCVLENPLPDACAKVRCGSNAYCQQGRCRCYEDFHGDPNNACRPKYDDDKPIQVDRLCRNMRCHDEANCSSGICKCNPGFEGDGFIDCWHKDPVNACDLRNLPPTMASCSNGKIRCHPGFKTRNDGACLECRSNDTCAANGHCAYDKQVQHYRCSCNTGFIGDGAIACIPGEVVNGSAAAQCRVPCHKFGTCDQTYHKCRCRQGFVGNGYTYCDFDCSQCLPEARCAPDVSQCVCPRGYSGDGIKICRPSSQHGRFTLRIQKESDSLRIFEGSGPIHLICRMTGDVNSIAARWMTPRDCGVVEEIIERNSKVLKLTIAEPRLAHSGRFVCQAGGVADSIELLVERRPEDVQKKMFLTSDDGILKVQSRNEPTVTANIWHIAEENKHQSLAITYDCKSDQLVYTSDGGKTIRWGNASESRLKVQPKTVFENRDSVFNYLAIDTSSGNIFVSDDEHARILVINAQMSGKSFTFVNLQEQDTSAQITVSGLEVHPRLSLVYWTQSVCDSKCTNSIKYAKMDDGKIEELMQIRGLPISLSLAVSRDESEYYTAGRLCWLEQVQILPVSRTELKCAQLESNGLRSRNVENKRSFTELEEPSIGLVQDDGAILWTGLYRTTYHSMNPDKSVHVKEVCCSNGFQSIEMHKKCENSITNACSLNNGNCRYFCLPGGEKSRVCRCPDDDSSCSTELV